MMEAIQNGIWSILGPFLSPKKSIYFDFSGKKYFRWGPPYVEGVFFKPWGNFAAKSRETQKLKHTPKASIRSKEQTYGRNFKEFEIFESSDHFSAQKWPVFDCLHRGDPM